MRSVILLSFALCFVKIATAQGNLQFNQVISATNSDMTVPAGKVWKIESYLQQQIAIGTSGPITTCGDLSRPRPFYIDGIPYHDIKGTGWGSGSLLYTAGNQFPIWLKAGQVCRTTCSGDILSILEFNVVP